MLQRRGSYVPQVTEYILPCFLTMDSSIPLPTQLENLTSAPGFCRFQGLRFLQVPLLFISCRSHQPLSGEANADVDARNFFLMFRAQDSQKTLIWECHSLKEKFEAMNDVYPAQPGNWVLGTHDLTNPPATPTAGFFQRPTIPGPVAGRFFCDFTSCSYFSQPRISGVQA